MPTYKNKTEERHEKHKAWRRENYAKKRDHIRQRDNASARRKRSEDPERFRGYAQRHKEKQRRAEEAAFPEPITLENNADREKIIARIRKEQRQKDNKRR